MPGHTKFQFSLAFLFALTTLCAVLLGLVQVLGGGRLPYLLAAWIVALMVLTNAVMRPGHSPRRRWAWAIACALASVYGPYGVAALHDWLFMRGDIWLRPEVFVRLWFIPGAVVSELVALATQHPLDRPPSRLGLFWAGLLSAILMAGAAWVVAKAPRARWVVMPLVGCLNAWGAFAVDAVARM